MTVLSSCCTYLYFSSHRYSTVLMHTGTQRGLAHIFHNRIRCAAAVCILLFKASCALELLTAPWHLQLLWPLAHDYCPSMHFEMHTTCQVNRAKNSLCRATQRAADRLLTIQINDCPRWGTLIAVVGFLSQALNVKARKLFTIGRSRPIICIPLNTY